MSGEKVDAVLGKLGGYGRYQWLLFVAMGMVDMMTSMHTFVLMFVGWTPEHHCTPWANHTLNQSVPWEENGSGEMAWSGCSMYQDPGREGVSLRNTTESCQLGWTYVWDREGETSIVSDWDLVCEQSYVTELSMTVMMVGSACGTLFLSPLADRWGRKTVLLVCLLLQAAVGVTVAFTQGPVAFVILQFFEGAFHTVSSQCGFLILVETFDKDTREVPVYSMTLFWAGGMMLLCPMAYFLPQWRHLQLAITLPLVLMVTYFWFVPESLSWLLISGNIEEAKKIISFIVRVNKLPPFDNLDKTLEAIKTQEKVVLLSESEDTTRLVSHTKASQNTGTVQDTVLQPDTEAGQDTVLQPDTEADQDTLLISGTEAGQDTVLLSGTEAGQDTVLLSDTEAGQDTLLISGTEAGQGTLLISGTEAGQDTVLLSDTAAGHETVLLSYVKVDHGTVSLPENKTENTTQDNDEVVATSTSNTVLDLFRKPRIRRYTIIMLYLSLVNSLAYFGISFSMPLLSGDKYINTLISGAVEMPAAFLIISLNRRVGRRLPFCIFILTCAGANITEIFLPSTTASGADLSSLRTAVMMMGKFGISGSYAILVLYGSEVFPTSIRSHAVGLCLCFESLGSIVSPQIVYAAKTMTQLPMTLFSVMTVIGAVVVLFLPETHNVPLPQRIEDVEHWGKETPLEDELL